MVPEQGWQKKGKVMKMDFGSQEAVRGRFKLIHSLQIQL